MHHRCHRRHLPAVWWCAAVGRRSREIELDLATTAGRESCPVRPSGRGKQPVAAWDAQKVEGMLDCCGALIETLNLLRSALLRWDDTVGVHEYLDGVQMYFLAS